MFRHPALGKVVGADALIAHSRAHLAAAQACDLAFDPLLLLLVELGGQHPHTLLPVLNLAALLLTGDHNAGWLVDQPDGGAGLVYMLAAGTGGTVDLHFNISRIDLHVHLFHLRQHGHRSGGGVDPAAGFRLRHPLDPVNAAFVFHPGVGPPAVDDEVRLLHAAKLGFVVVQQLHGPALPGGVHGVHPEQAVGKQGAFLTAHAAANLYDDAFVIVGVFGQQQNLQFPVEPLLFGLGIAVGLLAQLLHLRIGHELFSIVHLLLGPVIGCVSRNNGLQVVLFPEKLGRLLGVGVEIRLL